MIERDTYVFIPKMERFGKVVGEDLQNPDITLENGNPTTQKTEDLIPLFKNLDPMTSMWNNLRHNIVTVIIKIAGFFWRRITAFEKKVENLERQIEGLQSKQASLRQDADAGGPSFHGKSYGDGG